MSIDPERKSTESNNPVRNLSISEFYKDAVVFITGATGFLGKVLIEKLLRTCSDIKAIYIHIRPKRGVSSDFRYKDFLKHDIFNNVRLKNPVLLEKIVCVAGDVTQSKLGLSDADYEMVLNDVTIVIHSAATVKFNEPLKNAGNLNAHGTKRLMEMCMKMRKLKSFVHVSTAFSNPGRNYVEEIVYPSCSPLDKDSFMNCIEILPAEVLDSIFDIIKGPHPNTYTLTKSIAELIVSEYSQRFPVAIVRPSIITGSLAEPYPGWVDNTQAITGIIMEIGRGTIKSIEGDRDLVCDIIPVDIVANTLIGAAWRGYVYNSQSAQVYNCTSGQLRPIFWKELGFYTQKWSRKFPSKYLMLYPHFDFRTNRLMHRFYETFFHLLPAYVFDIILKWQGSKPIMMKIAKKLQISCDLEIPFQGHSSC
ncbi:putative fatty acyl-CoA reductase CG5065 isoform X2 [Hermetia illucens]|uniref:putative fatty acyl-CoA reductase CG5065 isoform X2 n=1 Tax=Hermetia illucens TaxID=343691 RepID=UPI0018CC4414|nr:putative fatty acyl-CoA reductase CG5065 isoform X2 [Hermetia illucens]